MRNHTAIDSTPPPRRTNSNISAQHWFAPSWGLGEFLGTITFDGVAAAVQPTPLPNPAMAARVAFFSSAGKEVLLVDFSHIGDLATLKAAADECRRLVATRPPSSVRTFVDVTGTWFDKQSIQVASELAAHNQSYVVRSAVIGVTGLRQIAFNAIVSLTKRNMRMFDTRADALAWLTQD